MTASLEIESTPDSPTRRSATTSAIISPLYQLAKLPLIIAIYFFQNLKNFLSNIRVVTPEQEEIINQMPSIQQNLRTDMNKATIDQQQIGRNIDDLKLRVARLEERRKQREGMVYLSDKSE